MECRHCGWHSMNEWRIKFGGECGTLEEAKALETQARKAASRMKGRPRAKVYIVGRAVLVELKYSRGTIDREYKVADTQSIAGLVIAEFNRKF